MAYHSYFPFKTRIYEVTSTTSNSANGSATVIGRGKIQQVWYATSPGLSHTSASALDITVNGSTATGLGALTVTTSTGNSASGPFVPTANVFLKAGDVLATVLSSCCGGTATIVVQEF